MHDNPETVFDGRNRLIELISLIYSAVGEPILWPTVMDGIDVCWVLGGREVCVLQ